MDLRETIRFINRAEKELNLFNLVPGDPIVESLETFFQTQNVRITTNRTASGEPSDIAVLSNTDKLLEITSVETLRELLTHSQSGAEPSGISDTEYEEILGPLKETTFTSYDTREMLYASREIEDRAHRVGEGTIHAGFQRCSIMAEQRTIYRDLAHRGVTVHTYGVPDARPPELGDGQVHQTRADEIADFWFVVFDGGGKPAQQCALLAEHRTGETFYGAWTYDPAIVDSVCDHLVRTYLSTADTTPRSSR